MSKRKNRFENSLNAEIFNYLDSLFFDLKRYVKDLEAYCKLAKIKIEPWQDAKYGRIAINQIRELHRILQSRLESQEIDINPQATRHKGKGKLNLHETDKETRERFMKFKKDVENDWGGWEED